MHSNSISSMPNFIVLASFCSQADWLGLTQLETPKIGAHMVLQDILKLNSDADSVYQACQCNR